MENFKQIEEGFGLPFVRNGIENWNSKLIWSELSILVENMVIVHFFITHEPCTCSEMSFFLNKHSNCRPLSFMAQSLGVN